jgi:hypothetical protein
MFLGCLLHKALIDGLRSRIGHHTQALLRPPVLATSFTFSMNFKLHYSVVISNSRAGHHTQASLTPLVLSVELFYSSLLCLKVRFSFQLLCDQMQGQQRL